MMRRSTTKKLVTRGGIINPVDRDSGVSHLLEYLIISGIVIIFMIILIPMTNQIFIEGPANQLTFYALTDIGNGVSTRIIDLYAVIPYYNDATITTKFDIPDDIAGRDYWVEIVPGPPEKPHDQSIIITGSSGSSSRISLSGIGETIFGRSEGRTTASGLNRIEYSYP
jgi:hypothetical protein